MNKTLRLVAATFSLSAIFATAAVAQDKPIVQPSPTTGKPVVMVPMTANASDKYKAAWVFRNLDDREVKRFRAAGFSDTTIKGAANIAMRTGLDIDYVFRRIRDSGMPLNRIASMYNVSTFTLNEEIPGYGAEAFSVMPSSSMNTTGSAGSSSMSMPSRSTTTTTTETTTQTPGSSTTPATPTTPTTPTTPPANP